MTNLTSQFQNSQILHWNFVYGIGSRDHTRLYSGIDQLREAKIGHVIDLTSQFQRRVNFFFEILFLGSGPDSDLNETIWFMFPGRSFGFIAA